MKNNRGFTLLELMVVVAILGIVTGMAAYSITSVSDTRARKFASDFNALLSECRVNTLSGAPAPVYLTLSWEGGEYYGTLYEGGSQKTRVQLPRSVACSFTADGTVYDLGETYASLSLGFDRSTGAFEALEQVKSAAGDGLNPGLSGGCTAVTAAAGGGARTVELTPATGYHRVVR
jgi:prepilin-type N-terminal cleavage/methylation domain-containing protein